MPENIHIHPIENFKNLKGPKFLKDRMFLEFSRG